MIAAEDVARLQQIVGARLGLRLEPAVCRDVLARRAHRAPAGYLDRLDRDPAELRVLVSEITVGETYFFRHAEQLAAFAEVALPDRLRATTGSVHVLSAGCSSGEEPYTLAMLARGQPEGAARVVVRGVDVNEAALVHAARGRYSAWSLRALPASLERWFVRRSRDIELSPEIRGAVTFERRNLAEGPAWPPVLYDIVFCRNVLIYFTEEATRDLLARLVAMLAPGGYLFLGHSEILRERSGELELCQSHNTFYYRRAVPVRAAAPVWPVGILASSQRVSALVDRADRAAPVEPAPEAGAWADELARARALFGAERFADALDQLDRLPAAAAADPDALRMRAIALAERGEV
ncbi:MAG: CheR family methyltransferase, partial [Kofleriaceae bacterium]